MQLNPSEISELIKDRIKNFESAAEARTEGTVVSLTDGIARIHGLADVMSGEMIEFPGDTFGMALNLERDSVGAVIRRFSRHEEGIFHTGRRHCGAASLYRVQEHGQDAV